MAKIRQQRDAGLWYLSGAIKEKSRLCVEISYGHKDVKIHHKNRKIMLNYYGAEKT